MSFLRAISALLLAAVAPFAAAAGAPAIEVERARVEEAIEAGRLVQARAMIGRAALAGMEPAVIERLSADLALAERRDEIALALFEKLRAGGADDCALHEGAGIAALRLDRLEPAIVALETATSRCADRWKSWSALAVAYDRSARWPDSERAYRAALPIAKDRASVLNNYGFSLILQRRHAEALVPLREAAALAPGNRRIANNVDIATISANGELDAPGAQRAGERWAERLNNAGYAAMLTGDRQRAIAYLSRSVHASDAWFTKAAANLAKAQQTP